MNADEARARGLGAARGILIAIVPSALFWAAVWAVVR